MDSDKESESLIDDDPEDIDITEEKSGSSNLGSDNECSNEDSDPESETQGIESTCESETDDDDKLLVPESRTATKPNRFRSFISFAIIVIIAVSAFKLYNQFQIRQTVRPTSININFAPVEEFGRQHPDLLSTKKMRVIKTRLAVMQQEISVLMLLGRSRDKNCRSDITFCLAQSIVNATQMRAGYINAANPSIKSFEIERELRRSLGESKNAIMIDSLEKLPGSEVMNLFQFIDKDEEHERTGMLLFTVYTGHGPDLSMKEADIAEKVLIESWSSFISKDSLTSVISRMCKTIVKLY